MPFVEGESLRARLNRERSWQLYLQPFPGPGPRYPITVDGGDHAVWAPDGSRIYYSIGPRMYEAEISRGMSTSLLKPTK